MLESPDAAPKAYTKEEVKQSLIAYKDERTPEYNDRTREGEGLTNQYSEQWKFYDKNLAADKSLSDYGDTALGAFAGFMDTGGGMVQGVVDIFSDPAGTAQNMSLGMQQMLNEPEGTVSSIFEQREDGQINAALDNLQGDYFNGARTGMSTDLGFALDMGLLPVGRVGGLKLDGTSATLTGTGVKWGEGINNQGLPWEGHVIDTQDLISPGVNNFKTFDGFNFECGLAVSCKTMDLNASTYKNNSNSVFNNIKKYVDSAVNFSKDEKKGFLVVGSDVPNRAIELAIPPGPSVKQTEQINRALAYAKEKGIELKITEVKN